MPVGPKNMHDKQSESLKRGMKSRHLTMIAVGGTISASFFLGIGEILHKLALLVR